ncbi:MAG: alpha/beta hydrolase [Alphaproteobacteria bacterium]|nr:alpha/beta hydrolase [Alphaproteobacteria bacterium]
MNLTLHFLPCSYDGEMRYGKSAPAKKAAGTVLLLPGWGEWIEKYKEVISSWNERGYNVVIAEWRGQGLSSRFLMDRKKTWLPSFDLLVEDLERLFKTELGNEKKIILLCHSMGAHIGLRWFLERGRKYPSIKAVILVSMLHRLKTAPIPSIIALWIIKFAAWLGFDQAYAIGQKDFDQAKGTFESNPLTQSEAHYQNLMAHLTEKPELKVGGLTYGWLYAFLQSAKRLEQDLARGAPRIPYLVMGSQEDPLVETSGFTFVASMLPNCKVQYLHGAKHELLQEKEEFRLQTWEWMDQFLTRLKA